MVEFGKKKKIEIGKGNGLIKDEILSKEKMEEEKMRWVEKVVIGLIKIGNIRENVIIMKVRRIGRKVEMWSEKLSKKKDVGKIEELNRDIVDEEGIGEIEKMLES